MASGYKGKLGAIIVTLALITSVFIGYAVNVDKTTSTETEYEYVTDVSGLFDYDKTPSYVDYDVTKNYTGYQEYSPQSYSTTDTFTNTFDTSETWYTSFSYTGQLPVGTHYKIYSYNLCLDIDIPTVTYTSVNSSANITYTDVTKVETTSSGFVITYGSSDTTRTFSMNMGAIIVTVVDGINELSTGGTTLYKVQRGSTVYLDSSTYVYQFKEIGFYRYNTSSSEVTTIGNGASYVSSSDYDCYVTKQSVNIVINSTTDMLTDSGDVWYGGMTGSFTETYSTYSHQGGSLLCSAGWFLISPDTSRSMYSVGYFLSGSASDGGVTRYAQSITFTYTNSTTASITLPATTNPNQSALTVNFNPATAIYSKNISGAFETEIHEIQNRATYYYTSSNNTNLISFDWDSYTSMYGVTGATASTTYTDMMTGTVPHVDSVFAFNTTISLTSSETYTNTTTGDTAQLGTSYTGYFGFDIEYDFYAYQSHITIDGDMAYLEYRTRQLDTITLTSPLEITSDSTTLVVKGDSTYWGGYHRYTVSLSSGLVYGVISDPASILTGTSINRIANNTTAYYKSTDTVYAWWGSSYPVLETALNSPTLTHGVYSATVSYPAWTTATTVTSDSYTAYNYNVLTPSGEKGISYTTTTQPNAYVIGSASSVGEDTATLSTQSMITVDADRWVLAYSTQLDGDSSTGAGNRYVCYKTNKYVTIQNFVASLGLPSGTTNVTITFNSIGDNATTTNLVYFASLETVSRAFDNAIVDINSVFDNDLVSTGYSTLQTANNESRNVTAPCIMQYDVTNNTITYANWLTDDYGSSVNLAGSSYAFYYTTVAPSIYTQNVYSWSGSSASTTTADFTPTSNLIYTRSTESSVYMDINAGVTVDVDASQNVARWSNGYTNGSVSILFNTPDSARAYSNTITASTGDTVTIAHSTSHNTTVTLNNGTAVDVGAWNTYILTLDAQNGTVTVTPVDRFASYTNYTATNYTFTIGGMLQQNGQISYIDFSYSTASWGFQVCKTSVFLNTYGAVMHNPTVDVSKYFTDIDEIRLSLNSFALYGDSVTINGTTYYGGSNNASIRSTGNIVIGTQSYAMQGLYVTFDAEDNHTYLTFTDDKYTVDLGATTTKQLSFSGYWYFTTELYEGNDVIKTSYDWNIGTFAISIPAMALLMAGLIIAGVILVRRFAHIEMTAIDWILIVCAIVLAIVLAGGILI